VVAVSEANRDELETESIRAGLRCAGVPVAPRTSCTGGYADSIEGGTSRSRFAVSACFVCVAISRSPGLLYLCAKSLPAPFRLYVMSSAGVTGGHASCFAAGSVTH
jgi:hypothetical protein